MLVTRLLRSLIGRSRSGPTGSSRQQVPPAPGRTAGSSFPTYQGYYINLDRSADRRRAIESQLQDLGLHGRYARFPAVDGRALGSNAYQRKPGEIGCYLSHLGALEAGRHHDTHLHVVEDDVLLGRSLERCLEAIIDQGLLADYDLVYTNTLVPFKPALVREYLRVHERAPRDAAGRPIGCELFDLRGKMYATHSSYLVNKHSVEKIVAHLRLHAAAGMPMPVDIHLKNLVNEGALRAACTVPFLTGIRLDDTLSTTIHGQYDAVESVVLHNLLRNQLFADRDDNEFEQYFEKHVDRLDLDAAGRNIARLSAFFLSSRHRDF